MGYMQALHYGTCSINTSVHDHFCSPNACSESVIGGLLNEPFCSLNQLASWSNIMQQIMSVLSVMPVLDLHSLSWICIAGQQADTSLLMPLQGPPAEGEGGVHWGSY